MAKLYNLARMTTATTGTGTITLGAAVNGYLTFAQAGVANGEVVDYAIKDGSSSEQGTGTYTSSGATLTRTVTRSTNSNAPINLSGTAEVFISPRAETLNDAGLFITGTLADARLSNNVPLKNAANAFNAAQTISVAGGFGLTVAGGDISAHRGTAAGALFLGNGNTGYLYFDGGNYFFGTAGSVYTGGGAFVAPNTAKAWARWNGANGAIISSFNVSSVTRNSTGLYTMNFTNALPSASYASSGMARATTSYNGFVETNYNTTITTTAFQCVCVTNDGAGVAVFDPVDVCVLIFG